MKSVGVVGWVAIVLVIFGGINYGLVGFFDYNLIQDIFGGQASVVNRIIYAFIGVASVWMIFFLSKCCCGVGSDGGSKKK